MKKELFFSLLLLASGSALATDLPASSPAAEQAVCKCGEGCDCLKTHDTCPCDKVARNDGDGCGGVCTKSGEKDDRYGGCGGVCGRSMTVCAAECSKNTCEKGADQQAAA